MPKSESQQLQDTLSRPDIHEEWIEKYLSHESDAFFEMAFDHIAKVFRRTGDDVVLDAGCGNGVHAMRLARRGFSVRAVDFSEDRLKEAAQNVADAGMADRITLAQEDNTRLSFPDASFSNVMCWGVLMHIPDVESAVSELARVVKPGGLLVIGENNLHSFDHVVLTTLRKMFRRNDRHVSTASGMERWVERESGLLLIRTTDIGWLAARLADKGLVLRERRARQFTELFTKFSNPFACKAIHGFNNFWFRRIRAPQLSFGNLLVFEKRTD